MVPGTGCPNAKGKKRRLGKKRNSARKGKATIKSGRKAAAGAHGNMNRAGLSLRNILGGERVNGSFRGRIEMFGIDKYALDQRRCLEITNSP